MIYYLQEICRARQSKTKINLHTSTDYIRIKQDSKQIRGSTRNRKETSSFWDAELTRTASDLIQGKQPANVAFMHEHAHCEISIVLIHNKLTVGVWPLWFHLIYVRYSGPT